MVVITVRVPDELKSMMDSLDEVNWSAVTRNLLKEKVNELFIRSKVVASKKQIELGNFKSHEDVKKMFLK